MRVRIGADEGDLRPDDQTARNEWHRICTARLAWRGWR